MRCTGSGSGDCCLTFAANGQCSDDLSCTTSGPNYIATESNNFICSTFIIIFCLPLKNYTFVKLIIQF